MNGRTIAPLRRRPLLLACLHVIALIAAESSMTGAQAPNQRGRSDLPDAPGLILGTVVDDASSAPVASVLVTLSPAGPAQGREPRRAITGASGRFAFRDVTPGSYTLTTTVGGNGYSPGGFIVSGLGHLIGGYLNGGYGQRRPEGPLATLEVRGGERLADAVIRIWKGAAIDGSVFDESGEPLVGVVVAAVRVSTDGRLLTGPTTKTDDRGKYHVGALVPGDYVVVVPQMQVTLPQSTIDAALAQPDDRSVRTTLTGSGGVGPTAGGLRAGDRVLIPAPSMLVTNDLAPAMHESRQSVYQSTFHPASASFGKAAVVRLRSGEERAGVDVHLHPVPAVQLSGTLADDVGPVGNFALRLLRSDSFDSASALEIAMTATDASGAFTFPLVPPGEYRIVAERPPGPVSTGEPLPAPRSVAETSGAWANRHVSVRDEPIDGIRLTLRPGLAVSGRLAFHGSTAPPTPDRFSPLSIRLTRMNAGRLPAWTYRVTIDPTGAFVFPGLPPGRYLLRTAGIFGWTLQSVSIAGRDVTDAAFELVDADVDAMQVSFTDQPAALSGTVANHQGETGDEAAVFVFPADRSRWRDARMSTATFRTVRTARNGAFTMAGVLPGSYLVAAAPDAAAGGWPDETFLATLAAGATVVRINAGQQLTVALRTGDRR